MSVMLLRTTDFKSKPATEAAAVLGRKVPLSSNEFDLLKRESRARAFRIAGINKVQLIQKAMDEVTRSIRDGVGLRETQLRLMRLFSEEGLQQFPMHRLRLVMRQNELGAYNVARKRMLDSPAVTAAFPYRMYVTVGNGIAGVNNVRETHARFHGLVFAWDDSFWSHFHPPWGYNCRCFTRPVSADEVDRSRHTVWTYVGGALAPLDPTSKRNPVDAEPEPEFDFDRDQTLSPFFLGQVDRRLREFLDKQLEAAEREALRN